MKDITFRINDEIDISSHIKVLCSTLLIFLTIVGFLSSARAQMLDRVVIGALRFSSSGALFLARDRGYFKDEGLDTEIQFFDAAPNVAVAVASGEVGFGATALTAAFFNLAGEGRLKILAGQAQEKKGHSGNLVLVTRQAFEAGFKTLDKLTGQPFGLTQFGSPSHYQLGQLARAHGLKLADIPIQAFQTIPNLVAAIKGGKITWAIIAPPIATDLVASGDMIAISRYSDHASYQFGVLFATGETVERYPALVQRFLRAYKRGLRDYAALGEHAADVDPTMLRQVGDTAKIIARYVYPNDSSELSAQKVRQSIWYADPLGRVDEDDIAKQINWYHEQRMTKKLIEPRDILRLEFLHSP